MPTVPTIKLVKVTLTNPSEAATLEPFSNSKIVAIDQCPTWGTVRYGHHKGYDTEARAMALEAGSAMHEVFSAVRVWQLARMQKQLRLAAIRAEQIFTKPRWKKLGKALTIKDDRDSLLELAFSTLHSSGFYDDPRDEIRTLANMEVSTIQYCDEHLEVMDRWPIYYEDTRKPFIGIEQVVDCVLHYSNGDRIRYIGTVDGVMRQLPSGRLFLAENKTSVRLDEGWRMAFETSHQVTGYCVLGTTLLNKPMFSVRVYGLKLKQSANNMIENYTTFEPQDRTEEMIQIFARSVWHTVFIDYLPFKDDYEHAPRRTHSCNRYFRPCALIDFCADTVDGRAQQYSEMVQIDPSPSERAVMETV